MSALSNIARLFAELAVAVRRPSAAATADRDGEEEAAAAAAATATAVSSLAASLRPSPDASSEFRVLDAALSLMCFRAPEVYSSTVDCVVETMISVLSSSICCEARRLGKGNGEGEEILRVGGSICSADRGRLFGMCFDVLESLKGHVLCQSLVHALLKLGVLASDCQRLQPMSCMYYERSEVTEGSRKEIILKLQSLLPEENCISDCDIPLRLFLWYLDPLLFKDALSNILRETIHRPFLCLKNEFHGRMAWRLLIICLVTSPSMFIQARALLHKWFLVTGLASVLELQVALISSLLDVLSRPMWWGIPMELGSKLPFSHAYFSTCHSELLAVLSGSISCESFLDLVNLIGIPLASTGNNMNLTAFHLSPGIFHWKGAKLTMVDYNSTWAILMNFPAWFYFATSLIFAGEKIEGIFLTNCSMGTVEAESRTVNETELHRAAVIYIAFILSPLDVENFELCFNLVNEISQAWATKSISDSSHQSLTSEIDNNNMLGRSKKLRKPNPSDTRSCTIFDGHEYTGIQIWLGEFHKYCEKFRTVTRPSLQQGKTREIINERSSSLFRRICLGTLISCASYLDERECSLLLDYAATGETLSIDGLQIVKNEEQRKKKLGTSGHEYSGLLSSISGSKWAIKGATLVFDLFDCIEETSSSLCGSEDERQDFIRLMKGKAGGYLLKCIKELLLHHAHLDGDGGEDMMLKDLSVRLLRWRPQDIEVIEGCGAFNEILDDLNRR